MRPMTMPARHHRYFALALLGLTLGCQSARPSSPPAPPGSGITLGRDFWPVECRFGYSDAKPVLLAFDLTSVGPHGERVVVETLERAGYTVELFVINTYRTVPRIDWPEAASPDVRRHTHPGTAVLLVMGMDADGRRHTFGGVHALCKSEPGAPDSITTVAQSLDARIVEEAFANSGIGPYRPFNGQ